MPSTYIGYAALVKRAEEALKEAVGTSAKQLSRKAKATAPVDEGDLRAGIRSTGAKVVGNGRVEAVVKTGPATKAYAIIQHERDEGVEYIEGPLLEHAHQHAVILAAAGRKKF